MTVRPLFLLLSFALLILGSGSSYPQNASLCHDVVKVIEHPEQYAIDTVTEKIKKEGISCVFHSSCCLPGWQLDPFCYVISTVTHKRKTADAWNEYKKTTTCEDYPIDKAIKTLFRDVTRPETALSRIAGLDPFFRILAGDIAVARSTARPLPDDLRKELIGKFRALHVKTFWVPAPRGPRGQLPPEGSGHYDTDDGDFGIEVDSVNDAVWLKSDDPAAVTLWALRATNPGTHAITFENLIIVSPEMLSATGCDRLAYWAHEITHVKQYKQNVLEGFLNPYIVDGINNGYCGIPAEVSAYNVENEFRSSCRLSRNQCT